jgi:N-acetylmuramoyl-L-alanine amidase
MNTDQEHVVNVKEGESIPSLAWEFGLHWETIWNHEQNQELRNKRIDPNILEEGDSVFIPALTVQEYQCQTDMVHRFRRRGVPSVLRIRLMQDVVPDEDEIAWLSARVDETQLAQGKPFAAQVAQVWSEVTYRANIDGAIYTGKTAADGIVSLTILPNAQSGWLEIDPGGPKERRVDLKLGVIEPISTIAGVKKRLTNLGISCVESSETRGTVFKAALASFQLMADLEPSGELDDTTRDKLVEWHGS